MVANVATTLTVPLSVQLRLGAVTATEVIKQLVTAAGMAILAVAGAGLLAFFAVNVAAGVASLALAIPLAGAAGRVWPIFAPSRWMPLLREAAPVALALAVNVLYVRALIILMSLLASPLQTGYFATSYRVLEVFVFVPLLMLGSAFPVLAHAGDADESRLAYALQRLAEVTLLTAVAIVLVLVIAAEPIINVLGGSEYEQAADVLRIQAFALLGAFLTQVWVTGLVSIRRQSALVLTNCVALGTALVLGVTLIPGPRRQGRGPRGGRRRAGARGHDGDDAHARPPFAAPAARASRPDPRGRRSRRRGGTGAADWRRRRRGVAAGRLRVGGVRAARRPARAPARAQARKRKRISAPNALIPSRHVIFLPSAMVLP